MPYVKSLEFLKKYPAIWNKGNWDDYVSTDDENYFSIPFDLDPSHLGIDSKHGKCPPELKPFVEGTFFIDYIGEFIKPFDDIEFYTFFDSTQLYFYKWDGNELYCAIIDYNERLDDLKGRRKLNKSERENEYEILDSMLDNKSADDRFKPEKDDWQLIYAKEIKKLNKGDIESSVKRGEKFYRSEKYRNAIDCFLEAANQGHVLAQQKLGSIYFKTKEFFNREEGLKWYKKASDQGDAFSSSRLGFIYQWGEGVETDIKEALKWYRKAADQGDSDAESTIKDLEKEVKETKQKPKKTSKR